MSQLKECVKHRKSADWNIGQSLVEVALFMPLALIMIAGLVEISQWLLIQNRVTTAVRSGVRFGADGGSNQSVADVTLNTVTNTLDINSTEWDIWVLRGTVSADETGQSINFSGGDTQLMTHVFGDGLTDVFAEINEVDSEFMTDLQNQLLDELLEGQIDDTPDGDQLTDRERERADGLQFVGVYAVYKAESILGFERYVPRAYEVKELALMRTFPSGNAANGCTAFPLVIRRDARPLYASLQPNETPDHDAIFPTDFKEPTGDDVPIWFEFPRAISAAGADSTDLDQAQQGWVYQVFDTGGDNDPLNFVRWNIYVSDSANSTKDAMVWPGNSHIYDDGPTGQAGVFYGFEDSNPSDPNYPNDRGLSIGDWLPSTPARLSSVDTPGEMVDHVSLGRQMRVVVIGDMLEVDDPTKTGPQTIDVYPVEGFAIIKPLGYNLGQGGGSSQWLLFEFVRWDESCGQED